ncbi:MAG: hypothetical protein OXD49_22520 [Candidatus Poribacteria bacterium]|nr:hypothetical protein [Candidatus Poribacteria bacterium]
MPSSCRLSVIGYGLKRDLWNSRKTQLSESLNRLLIATQAACGKLAGQCRQPEKKEH